MTIREYFEDELDIIRQDHKLLQMIHWEGGIFFIPRIVINEVTDRHIQIAKECVYDKISDLIFGGCEPTFYDDYSYDWWHGLCLDWYEVYEYRNYSNRNSPHKELRLKMEHKIPKIIFEL